VQGTAAIQKMDRQAKNVFGPERAWRQPAAHKNLDKGEVSMNGRWRTICGVLLGVVMACAMFAPRLQAGPAPQGKFTLPLEAQWGKTTLAAGDYTLSIENHTSMATIWIAHEGRNVSVILSQSLDYRQNTSKNAELVCIRHDGVLTVRELRIPKVGTYYFNLPKNLKVFMAEQPQMIETLPVQSVGE
jgi:hypothetical protein